MARHKWEGDVNGKQCEKCGSRVNTRAGMVQYVEVDQGGVSDGVNWYPRCNPPKTKPNETT